MRTVVHSFSAQVCTLHMNSFATCVAQDCASFKKSRSISRAMSHAMTHGTRTTCSSSFSFVPGLIPPRRLITSTTLCADPRKPHEGDSCLELFLHTGYEPERIVDNQIIDEQENVICNEDDEFTENEDHVKASSYNQSFLSSTQGSPESIIIPQEADFDDEQIRALLSSSRFSPEREASAKQSQVYHSARGSLMSSSSQGLKSVGTGERVALFSRQSRVNQDAFTDGEQFVDVSGSNESVSRFSNFFCCDGNRDLVLLHARSELMKQEHEV